METEEITKTERKRPVLLITVIALLSLAVVSLGILSFYLYQKQAELRSDLKKAQKEIASLKKMTTGDINKLQSTLKDKEAKLREALEELSKVEAEEKIPDWVPRYEGFTFSRVLSAKLDRPATSFDKMIISDRRQVDSNAVFQWYKAKLSESGFKSVGGSDLGYAGTDMGWYGEWTRESDGHTVGVKFSSMRETDLGETTPSSLVDPSGFYIKILWK